MLQSFHSTKYIYSIFNPLERLYFIFHEFFFFYTTRYYARIILDWMQPLLKRKNHSYNPDKGFFFRQWKSHSTWAQR